MPLLLGGCEARLDLQGINQELQKTVRRTDQFQSVATNDSHLVAVANDGVMLVSSIDNINWQRTIVEGEPAFVEVVSCADQSFVALSMDKKVWVSEDNGGHWQASRIPTSEDVLSLACAPDNRVWVVGSFTSIFHADKGSDAWDEQTLNEDAMLTSIQFVNEQTVYLTGEFGLVVRSDDGGFNWNPPEYIPDDFYIHGAFFRSENEGWAGGLNGQIYHTTDGGVSWSQQTTPTDSPVYGFLASSQGLFAYGDHSTVLKNDGDRWQRLSVDATPVYLRGAAALPDGGVMLAGGNGSLFSMDLLSPSFIAEHKGP
nr:YCF48-related protein [Pseudomaricurvus alcaniphilus]